MIAVTGNQYGSSIFYNDTTLTREYYLQKSHNQKTAAWVMLGTGLAATIVGMVGVASNYHIYEESSSGDAYGVVALIGTGLALGSIPLFIASGRNYRHAATLSFKNQHLYIPQQGSYVMKSQPALSLVIPL